MEIVDIIPEKVYIYKKSYLLYPVGIKMSDVLVQFVKQRRKYLGMTQQDLAERAGVGLRFIRDLEQGKKTLRMDKVNLVLILFGHELGPVSVDQEAL